MCGFRFNVDCSDRALDLVEFHAERAAAETGRRIAVVGHSRGGHFARALAARRPDLVSHAVSIGSDLQGMFGISAPTRAAVGLARRARRSPAAPARRRASARAAAAVRAGLQPAVPGRRVRLTSIYSRGDGVVRWERAIVDEADNVEVTGSHVGLAANRKAYRAIAAALAEPELERADA